MDDPRSRHLVAVTGSSPLNLPPYQLAEGIRHWHTHQMLNKPFRWLAFIVLNLFLIDEVLPLLDPWRGTHAQWNATFIVAAVLALPLAAALVRIIRLLRLGSDKGGRDFDWSIEPNLPKLHTAYHLLKSDPEAALRQLKWLADVGSVASMIYVGLFYKRDANPKNPEEAESGIGVPLMQARFLPTTALEDSISNKKGSVRQEMRFLALLVEITSLPFSIWQGCLCSV